MNNKNLSVVFYGDNCVDLYEGVPRRTYVGGNAINTAVHAKETGINVSYVGAVGNDIYGMSIIKAMEKRGINVDAVQVFDGDSAWTKVTFIGGERVFEEEYTGPAARYVLSDDTIQYLKTHRIVHNTWQGETLKYLPVFKKEGMTVSMDFGERYSKDFLEQAIPYVDIAFFSLEPEKSEQAKEFGENVLNRGPNIAVITSGKNGAICVTKDGKYIKSEARQIEAIDTLGAGDTFIGTFLGYYVKGEELSVCMDNATKAAADNCMIFGGFRGCEIIN